MILSFIHSLSYDLLILLIILVQQGLAAQVFLPSIELICTNAVFFIICVLSASQKDSFFSTICCFFAIFTAFFTFHRKYLLHHHFYAISHIFHDIRGLVSFSFVEIEFHRFFLSYFCVYIYDCVCARLCRFRVVHNKILVTCKLKFES